MGAWASDLLFTAAFSSKQQQQHKNKILSDSMFFFSLRNDYLICDIDASELVPASTNSIQFFTAYMDCPIVRFLFCFILVSPSDLYITFLLISTFDYKHFSILSSFLFSVESKKEEEEGRKKGGDGEEIRKGKGGGA